jgi:L-galactose dehydrogenase
MQRRALGATGLEVSVLGLGTCFMAGQGQERVDACVRYAVEHGVNYFDTAADYGRGHDEEMLGTALRGLRDRVILATKVGYTPDPTGHRDAAQLMAQFEGSLARLQTDYVDIIQVHEADFRKWWTDAPIGTQESADHMGALMADDEEYDIAGAPVMAFLAEAKRSGKARLVGMTAKNARLHARLLRAAPVDAIMTAHQFNPILRNAAEFLFPLTAERGIGVVNGAPFMKGWLATPQHAWRTERPGWMDAPFAQAYFAYLDLHAGSGLPLAELSLRWLLGEERQQATVVGFSALSDVQENIASAEKGPLPTELHQAIDALGLVHPLIYQHRTTV